MSSTSQSFDGFSISRRLRPTVQHNLGQITLWLVLAMAVGAWIAVSDGLTRDWIPELEMLGATELLQYEAYRMAWVFAGVTLPLILLHGAKLRMRVSESLLLWFMLCTAAYTKDFAYLKIPGAPVYITDVMLALALMAVFVWPRLRIPKLTSALPRSLLILVLVAVVDALRGFASGQDRINVLRDFAIVAYMLFLLPSYYARKPKQISEQFCLMTVCGGIVSTIVGVCWYLAEPGMRRYISYIAVPLAFILVVVAIVSRRMKLQLGIPLLLLLGWGVIVSNTRSTFLVLPITFAVMFLSSWGKKRWKEAVKPVLIGVIVMAIGITAALQTREGAAYVNRVNDQFVSLLIHGSDEDNAHWRILAWAEAGRRFLTNPVMGEGFGVPLLTEATNTGDVRPHNIYITILYKMGLVGFAAFVYLIVPPVFRALRSLRRYGDHPDAPLLRALFLCQVFSMIFGAMNPLIETPFMASMFWLNMGFMLRIARQIQQDSEQPPLAAAA
jgi:hypothetical protein